MHHFAYRRGVSHENVFPAGEVDLAAPAAELGTPFYCYSTATLERHYRVFADAFAGLDGALVCYSVKANSSLGVLDTLGRLGAGMDVVSEGELRRALAVNVPPERIAFSGVGKTKAEMAFALDAGIFAFNVESEPELRALAEVAEARGKTARIALRVNPDVDAKTHDKIATGKAENKFGVPFAEAAALYRLARELSFIEPAGVHMHIGSQITNLEPFRNAFALLKELVGTLRGQGFAISFVNLGGGLGIPYRRNEPVPPAPSDYAGLAREDIGDRAGAPDRRQCRHARLARALRKEGRGEVLHHRRRGDERPDQADALRGVSRDLAGDRTDAGHARHHHRRGRPGVRDRGLPRPCPPPPRPSPRRSHRGDDGRRLWCGARLRV